MNEYITALFNLSATTCRIPAIWKSSLIIPIPKPGKDTSQGTSYRPISLICPAVKVLESLFLPSINKYLIPAQDQHGFRREHFTTSALLQLTTDVAVGFNQRKPPDRTVCVAVDLLAAFDTVCHNNLLLKINRSQLPPATARWLSCYLRGRQANTCFRGVKSTSRQVNTGVPQSQQSPPPTRSHTPPTKQISDDSTFNVLQLNANGIGNKLTELEVVLERNKGKVAVIQESKLSPKSKNPMHPELHHSAQGSLPWSRRRIADLHSQIDNLLQTAIVTRVSIRSPPGRTFNKS